MTTDGLRLRPRDGDECGALADLWVESWAEAMPEIDFPARRAWFLDHLARLEADGALTLCAARDGALLGFVTVDPAGGFIDQIAVAPRAKGTGAGRALIAAARARARSALRLDVNRDNPRALRFYLREGFVVTGEGVNPRSGLAILHMRDAQGPG
ncbi:GNAT family N-acetyltransferase [Methylocella sp.]|uniref:GNAT family N-acetyltransferase n=1 Tax=Methylocella sp. TaxID=1978226 RepID=UPI0037843793